MFLKQNKFKLIIFYLLLFFDNTALSYDEKNFYYNFIDKINTFSSKFIQHTYDENGTIIKKSSGNLIYKKKLKYLLEYSKPNKVKFISDGKFITTIDEDLEQVIIQNQKKFYGNIFNIFTNKTLIEKNFNLTKSIINNEHYLKFTPIDKDIYYNIFLIVISNDKIKKITFMNDFDQSVTMIFSDFMANEIILDSLFKIDIPDEFDVIVDNKKE
tara:strand:- start:920 stop:1558 length:639 start_codon:yes stop_codon:yes gene_type:complete